MGPFGSIDLSSVEDPTTSVCAEQLAVIVDRGCPRCGAPPEPEPSDEERAKLLDDPDLTWEHPPGTFVVFGFGLVGGGYGPFAICDGCNALWKHDLGTEAE